MNTIRRKLAVVAAMAALVAGCSGPSRPDLTVVLTSDGIVARGGPVKAGSVKIDIDNGGATYDLLFVRTDLDPAALPTTASGELDLSKLAVVDRLTGVAPGHFRTRPPSLPPGNYVIVGQPASPAPGGPPIAHNPQAMRARLVVQPHEGAPSPSGP